MALLGAVAGPATCLLDQSRSSWVLIPVASRTMSRVHPVRAGGEHEREVCYDKAILLKSVHAYDFVDSASNGVGRSSCALVSNAAKEEESRTSA